MKSTRDNHTFNLAVIAATITAMVLALVPQEAFARQKATGLSKELQDMRLGHGTDPWPDTYDCGPPELDLLLENAGSWTLAEQGRLEQVLNVEYTCNGGGGWLGDLWDGVVWIAGVAWTAAQIALCVGAIGVVIGSCALFTTPCLYVAADPTGLAAAACFTWIASQVYDKNNGSLHTPECWSWLKDAASICPG